MTEDKRKTQLLELFSTMSGKTKIVEPMKNIHGTLRDSDAIEREVALVMREIIEQGIFKTSLKPIQLAKLVTSFYAGKNDTEIARELLVEILEDAHWAPKYPGAHWSHRAPANPASHVQLPATPSLHVPKRHAVHAVQLAPK